MCQLNTGEIHDIIEGNIRRYNGKPKLIDEWGIIINENLPKSRRLTTRELARVFVYFKKNRTFAVEQIGRSYAFHLSP